MIARVLALGLTPFRGHCRIAAVVSPAKCTECGVQISMSGLMAVHKTSEALAKEREKTLRIVRGEFGQFCSYCGWESSSEGASWGELQAHINNCTAHPLFALRARKSKEAE